MVADSTHIVPILMPRQPSDSVAVSRLMQEQIAAKEQREDEDSLAVALARTLLEANKDKYHWDAKFLELRPGRVTGPIKFQGKEINSYSVWFDQYYKGLPVEGGVHVHWAWFKKALIRDEIHDLGDFDVTPSITADHAVSIAKKKVAPNRDGLRPRATPKLVIILRGEQKDPVLCWEFYLHYPVGAAPKSRSNVPDIIETGRVTTIGGWSIWVDAKSGALLKADDGRRPDCFGVGKILPNR